MNEIVTIPLSRLKVADANVRHTVAGEDAHRELVASIRAHGLLNPLTVAPTENEEYAVAAGGRRLRALLEIAADDGTDPDPTINCLIIPDGVDPAEVSLAENEARVPMHPADQVLAFARLHDAGYEPEDIGNRFGYATSTVRKRLRLGRLPRPIIDGWKQGNIGEDAVECFGMTENLELVERVYNRILKENEDSYVPNWQVEQLIKEQSASAGSHVARYVGLKAYQKAGGRVEQTLFDNDPDEERLLDPDILQELADKKLERAGVRLMKKEGWAWVLTAPEFKWQERQQYGQLREVPAWEPGQHERHEAIDGEIDALERPGADAGYDSPAWKEFRAAGDRLRKEQQDLYAAAIKRGGFTDEQKAVAGAVLAIGYSGRAEITRGLVRPEDLPDAVALEVGGLRAGDSAKAAAEKKGPYPAKVLEDLRILRGIVVGRALALNPRAARDLIAFELARDGRFNTGRCYMSKEALLLTINHNSRKRLTPPAQKDEDYRAAAEEPWGKGATWEWLEADDEGQMFDQFMALKPGQKDRVLARAVADLLVPRLVDESGVFERLTELVIGDRGQVEARARKEGVSPWSEVAFWKRLTVAGIRELAAAELGDEWVAERSKLKKLALVRDVAAAFAEREWLPKGW
ncbi:MAG: ParB/RepB/Spo0J family partition protein [Acidobacteria bacterium]|nr:ParB/RepB/Spo0J family partition protein [Acidobacteriota bacterium]